MLRQMMAESDPRYIDYRKKPMLSGGRIVKDGSNRTGRGGRA